jgi:hypothetical protein
MAEQFDWGSLGREWWESTGASIGCDLRQIKFCCALHMGKSKTESARLAGYAPNSEDGARQEGHRAAKPPVLPTLKR